MNPQTTNPTQTMDLDQRPTSPARRIWLRRLFKIINLPMRLLLRLPFPTPLSRQLMLLSFTGRKTGRRYQQPVSYVPDGDTLLTPGGGKWKLNLQEGRPIRARIRSHDVQLRPEIIGNVDDVDRLLHKVVSINPRVASFLPVMGPNGQVDRTRLEAAVNYGFRIIRWHVAATGGT
jgi:hypothetical protein